METKNNKLDKHTLEMMADESVIEKIIEESVIEKTTDNSVIEKIMEETVIENIVVNKKIKDLPIVLTYLDKDGNIINLNINGSFWKYINNLSKKLTYHKFRGYCFDTLLTSDKFKIKKVENPFDFFRRCQILGIISMMALINGFFPFFKTSSGLIKIGPSKDLKKNCTIIDDSTILDKETNIIRDSNGDIMEPNRGFKLYNSLSSLQQQDVMQKLHAMLNELSKILYNLEQNKYDNFNPIEILQKIAIHCSDNKYESAINYLSMEVHDSPFLLTQEERNNLFNDYDSLKSLWDSGFITDNHGKLRIYIACIYFMESILKNKVLAK